MNGWWTWLTDRVATGAGSIDPEDCRRVAERARAELAPNKKGLPVADRVARRYARRAALHGSIAGLPLGPVRWLAGYLDAQNMTRTRLELPATLAYLADPAFFDRADWRDLVERWAQVGPSTLSPAASTVLSRLGRRLAARRLTASLAGRNWLLRPAGASSLFGLWNYLEVRWAARPAIERYREQVSPAVARTGRVHLRAVS